MMSLRPENHRKLTMEALEPRHLLSACDLLGDFNGNQVVEAADYTVWRDTLGSLAALAADANGTGMIPWTDKSGSRNLVICHPSITPPQLSSK